MLPEEMDRDYLNPIYQGWLTKEGVYVHILNYHINPQWYVQDVYLYHAF